MRALSIIYRRELGTYLRSPIGWIIAAASLLVEGVLFQAWGLSKTGALSADVLRQFFYTMSGVTMITAIILSIRLVAEERQSNSIILLNTSPVSDISIVLGKFFAALTFLTMILAFSVYMPLLVQASGKISNSQILIGYLGLFLIGAAYLAIGLFASALTRYQLVAGVLAAAFGGIMVMFFPLAKQLDPPFSTVIAQFDAWWGHFERGFMVGVLSLENVVYYLALTYFFLLLAVKTMEAKRWQ
jgi:ABC-2 type transport system permease protein